MRGLAAPRASSALSPPGAVLCCALLGWVGLCWAAAAAAAPQGPAVPAARPGGGERGASRRAAVVMRWCSGRGFVLGRPSGSAIAFVRPYLVSVPSPSVRLHCLGAISKVMVPAAFLPGASRAVISAPPLGMPRSSHGTYYSASVS